jgi:GNAT superfamily N-acetyltransferase
VAWTIEDVVKNVSDEVARRWRGLDPLLPEPSGRIEEGAESLVAEGPDWRPAGFAVCHHVQIPDTSLEQTWGTATKFVLRPLVTGKDLPTALDQLLIQWREHLAGLPEAHADDTAAVVNWPTRDVEGVLPLLRHGMQPITVLAARATPSGPAASAAATSPTDGVLVREADPADFGVVVDMEMGVIRYDAQFGGAIPRAATEALVKADTWQTLTKHPSWTWLAERDGHPVGLLALQPPQDASWIAPMTRAQPAAYLQTLFVQPAERGSGIGAALVREARKQLDTGNVAVTLLHHAQVNPVSGPFWNRMGYRPLWTTWETRPAAALR